MSPLYSGSPSGEFAALQIQKRVWIGSDSVYATGSISLRLSMSQVRRLWEAVSR